MSTKITRFAKSMLGVVLLPWQEQVLDRALALNGDDRPAPVPAPRRWLHPRRGVIEGLVVCDETASEWVQIRLTADSPRSSAIARGHGPTDHTGEIITVRRSFLKELA